MVDAHSCGLTASRRLAPQRPDIIVLHHLRWLAALEVVLGHIRNHLLVDFPTIDHPSGFTKIFYFISGYGHPAVIVFFVISGFLVGGKLVEMAQAPDFPRRWPVFVIDRWSRIFIVLWPALLVTALVVFYTVMFAPTVPLATSTNWDAGWTHPVSDDLDIRRWALNIFLLNEIAGPTVALDPPLWSLAFEWAYYMLALAAALLVRRVWSGGAMIFLIYTAILFALILTNAPEILTAGVAWIMGLVAKLASDRRLLAGRATWFGGVALMGGVLIYGRFYPVDDNLFGATVALAVAHSRWHSWRLAEKSARWLADFSFSLYATHAPVIAFLLIVAQSRGLVLQRLSFGPVGLIVTLGILVVTLVFARLVAFVTEDRTRSLRRWCVSLLVPETR